MNIPVAAATLSLIASSALAGTVFDMAGTANGMSDRQLTPMSESLILGGVNSTISIASLTEGHPFTGAQAACHGHLILQPPMASGAGICRYTTPAGDMAAIAYTIDDFSGDGGLHGSWSAVGGTGGLAGISGGGSFVNSPAADNGSFTQQTTGAISLP